MSSCACSGACSAPLPTETEVRAESKYLAIRFSLAAALFVSAVVSDAVGLPGFAGRVFYVSAWLAAGYSVVLQALRNLRCGIVFDENFLMSIATLGAFAIGEWAEGASVMLFYNLGELVQESAVRKSRKSIVDLLDLRPESVRLDSDGSQVHPADVAPGTRIRVHPGEVIPLDGVIVSGSSDLDTSALTGESLPRSANEGDTVFAGFVNGGGVLVIESSAPFNETAASKMIELVEHAQDRKARAEKRITAFARVYTPIVTILAGLLALAGPFVTSAFGGPAPFSREAFEPWIYRSLVFLVISCPCALVISIPLGFFGGIGGAARRGILVKGADFLDVLANAKAVVFDKTGTLTHGVFSVTGLFPTNGFDERALVRLASAAESASSHPLARAVCVRAESDGLLPVNGSVSSIREERGRGVSVLLDGVPVFAGSGAFLREQGVRGPSGDESGTTVHVARDGTYAGFIALGDELKADARQAVDELRALGVERVVMMTGDTPSAAKRAAADAGITDYEAGVLPHEKVERFEAVAESVRRAYPKGTVLFAGDGINDAPVLARSDAGIAMGAIGSDAAVQAADIVLMNDNPRSIAEAIVIARKTRSIVTQNIVLAFAVKALFLAGGAAGIASLWEAVFADVGVALLALLNSLRARGKLGPR